MENEEKEKLLQLIEVNPKVMLGKPVIKGTRIPVNLVLEMLADGWTRQEILQQYPSIAEDDITACILLAREALDNFSFKLY